LQSKKMYLYVEYDIQFYLPYHCKDLLQ
jgi:hypothetical protein